MGGNPAPAYGSGEAKGIEMARIVVGDARRKQSTFPLDGRGLEPFEPAEGFEDALFAGQLSLRGEMLPLEKPAHVVGGRNGLYLFAEGRDSATVNALQDTAFAPFDVVVRVEFRCRIFEGPSHEEALHLHRQECLKYGGLIYAQGSGQRARGSGTKDL